MSELSGQNQTMKVHLINFSQHALTDSVLAQIAQAAAADDVEVLDVPLQVDDGQPIAAQVAALVDELPWANADLQRLTLVVVLPGLAAAAAVLLAELHGRLGYFVTCARLRRADGPVVRFELAELVSLQTVREQARRRRIE